ncbi:hypothetical protein D3C80_1428180 [compost metagenome]
MIAQKGVAAPIEFAEVTTKPEEDEVQDRRFSGGVVSANHIDADMKTLVVGNVYTALNDQTADDQTRVKPDHSDTPASHSVLSGHHDR